MRSFNHLTPRYIYNRTIQYITHFRNPHDPWFSSDTIHFLDQWLRPTDNVFEWGSGRSTLWLSSRVSFIKTVEHNHTWHQKLKSSIQISQIHNIDPIFIPQVDINSYVFSPIKAIEDLSIDFAIVDGLYRDHCALAILPKIKPGGCILIDDSHRYLPSTSYSSKNTWPFSIFFRVVKFFTTST